jgi:hypothetical protein
MIYLASIGMAIIMEIKILSMCLKIDKENAGTIMFGVAIYELILLSILFVVLSKF